MHIMHTVCILYAYYDVHTVCILAREYAYIKYMMMVLLLASIYPTSTTIYHDGMHRSIRSGRSI